MMHRLIACVLFMCTALAACGLFTSLHHSESHAHCHHVPDSQADASDPDPGETDEPASDCAGCFLIAQFSHAQTHWGLNAPFSHHGLSGRSVQTGNDLNVLHFQSPEMGRAPPLPL